MSESCFLLNLLNLVWGEILFYKLKQEYCRNKQQMCIQQTKFNKRLSSDEKQILLIVCMNILFIIVLSLADVSTLLRGTIWDYYFWLTLLIYTNFNMNNFSNFSSLLSGRYSTSNSIHTYVCVCVFTHCMCVQANTTTFWKYTYKRVIKVKFRKNRMRNCTCYRASQGFTNLQSLCK